MGKNTVIIIGGGASGLMASIVAARQGAKVTLLERMDRLGKKILATGNGRCNLTNKQITPTAFHGQCPEFAIPALEYFTYEQTIEFFQVLGVYPRFEKNYVYPYSNQAMSVLDVLIYEVKRLKVNIHCNTSVQEILNKKKQYMVVTEGNHTYYAHKVILCTGGQSAPKLGSNGSGYDLAKALGHSLIRPLPALVQLKANESYLKQLKGVRVSGKVQLLIDGQLIAKELGEIQWTDYGLSGICIMQVSRYVSEALSKNKTVKLLLDFMPDLDEAALDQYLIQRFAGMTFKDIAEGLKGLFNHKLIPVLLQQAHLPKTHPISQMTKDQRLTLVKQIKEFTIDIIGTQNFEQSQVTAGGINTMEVDAHTLASKLNEHLYFAGEILDIDGDCGGFNLQWAWSSGYLAGMSATAER